MRATSSVREGGTEGGREGGTEDEGGMQRSTE